ncbi:MAG TPA: M15 family metallopeptidase [Bacteriovoracaceae bacterium]|nr:M15 family metallopeptidase [Bacteriovoracaceae bacterium]
MNILISFLFLGTVMAQIHPDFVSLRETCPGIILQMDYATKDNFTGSVVTGYLRAEALMAKVPAKALCRVQKSAKKLGVALKIFDSFRPVKAVKFFQAWAQKPEDDQARKALYYPTFTRRQLFEQGFIANKSSHSRGGAVDLTLVDLESGKELDMGSAFDFFDDLSNTESPRIGPQQLANRMLLKKLMEKEGFRNFSQEWWHYSFKPEPFPETYFDFDVN